jgi:hypothetical protein
MAANGKLDAIALLKADHRKVEELFAKFESARGAERKRAIAEQICLELSVHAKIEEDIFYPACEEASVEEDAMQEAHVEHDGAKVLITEILAGAPEEDFYDAKVKVLSEMIKHHVKEEERRSEGIFAQAREAGLDLEELGERLAAEKRQLTSEWKANGLPTPTTPTFKEVSLR